MCIAQAWSQFLADLNYNAMLPSFVSVFSAEVSSLGSPEAWLGGGRKYGRMYGQTYRQTNGRTGQNPPILQNIIPFGADSDAEND